MKPLILASSSPRRREILTKLGWEFAVIPAQNEESIDPALPLEQAVRLVAQKKAEEIAARYPDHIVIGADTVVAVDGQVLGKPADGRQACAMLRQLAGRTHEVLTGVYVCHPDWPGGGRGFTDCAQVTFYPADDEEIAAYVATGEPMDKAGAYGVQEKGLRFVKGIHGDFYTVMGLPGARLYRFLRYSGDEQPSSLR